MEQLLVFVLLLFEIKIITAENNYSSGMFDDLEQKKSAV